MIKRIIEFLDWINSHSEPVQTWLMAMFFTALFVGTAAVTAAAAMGYFR